VKPDLAARRPPLLLARSERCVLERAAIEGLLNAPRLAGALLDELRRAHVIDDEAIGPDVVRLGSRVTFREGPRGDPRTVRLIAPMQVDRGADDASVLSSTGAALLGLRAGQSILWADRVGGEQVLTVVSVIPPPENARRRS
jgi:regulator of nucleoside diphosphate kinase